MNYMPRKTWQEIKRPVYEYERLLRSDRFWNNVSLCAFLCAGLTGIFIWVLG